MWLSPPSYIDFRSLSSITISRSWNSGDPYANLNVVSDETVNRLLKVSNRGILGYSIGCALWTVHRYAGVVDITPLLEYVEACLPCLFGLSERVPNELPQDEWAGDARGPSQFAVFLIGDTWNTAEFSVPSEQGALCESLVLYDLPKESQDREKFLKWREVVLGRLRENCKRVEAYPDGSGVPLEILDPASEITHEDLIEKISAATRKINRSNRFLRDISDFKAP